MKISDKLHIKNWETAPKTSITIKRYNKKEGIFKLYSGLRLPSVLAFLKIKIIATP